MTLPKPKWNLVWLASYPKSGNTWFRIFLTNYLRDKETPAEINTLEKMHIASAREILETLYGFSVLDLTHDETDELRPAMYDTWQTRDEPFHKVHDAYTYLKGGQPLLGNPQGQAAIYFVRNPLDVAVSFSHHIGKKDVGETIKSMANPTFCFCDKKNDETKQLRQKLLTWSEHILSWKNAPIPVHFMRYEDMKKNPYTTFKKAIEFLGLPFDKKRLKKAIAFSDFEEVKKQESNNGFKEKSKMAKNFFRKGEVGSYKEKLTPDHIESITTTHYELMKEFNYLEIK
jgi:hypothetical protein